MLDTLVPLSKILENIKANNSLNFQRLEMVPPHGGRLAVVGGGPSLEKSLPDIRFKEREVMACNGAHDYLIGKKIMPEAMIMMDARPENVRFLQKMHRDVAYFISSQCDPLVWEYLRSKKNTHWVRMWDPFYEETRTLLQGPQVGGGCTVGLRAINLGFALGYRNFTLYGFDSSLEEENLHAYLQEDLNEETVIIDREAGGRAFKTTLAMNQQVEDFFGFWEHFGSIIKLDVHGDGLLPTLWREQQEKKNAAVAG